MTYRMKAPAVIDAKMAAAEQLFTTLGAAGFAKLMAEALRDPTPRREILDTIARLLDPHPDDDLALVVERRSAGNTKMQWTKRREDIEIALAVLNFQRKYVEDYPMRGSRKKAVGRIADERGISDSKVQQALKVLSLIPK
jgi:hypothetical protein